MSTNKNAIIRYQALDRCFRRTGKKYFIEDLIEACNEALYDFNGLNKKTGKKPTVKRRQIFDDINYMESEAGWQIPLEKTKEGKRKYYHYKDPDFSIRQQPLTQREVEQLQSVILSISRYRNLQSYGWVEEIIATLENRFDIKDKKVNVIGFESNNRLRGIWQLNKILDAASSQHVLKIQYCSYKNRDNENGTTIVFHPYYVKQYNNRWFVFGLWQDKITKNGEKKNRLSNLALDRIVNVEKDENVSYIKNTKIDFDHYFDNIVGVTIPGGEHKKVEHIVLKATPGRFPYIETKPIHSSQKTIDKDECELSIDVIPNNELDQQLLSFGPDIEVKSPLWYREHIAEIIKRNFEKYFAVQNESTGNL